MDVDEKTVFYRYNKANKDIESWYKVKIYNSNIEIYVSVDGMKYLTINISNGFVIILFK